jgi:hypothetical protein
MGQNRIEQSRCSMLCICAPNLAGGKLHAFMHDLECVFFFFFFCDGRREFVGCCTNGRDGLWGLSFFKKRGLGGERWGWSEVGGERKVGLGLKIFAKWLLQKCSRDEH